MQIGTLDLVYGVPGSTKTSRIGDMVEYWYEKTGLKARLVSTDEGGFEPIQSFVDAGILEVFVLNSERPYYIQDVMKLAQGYWPENPKDPLSPISDKLNLSGLSFFGWDGLSSTAEGFMYKHLHAVKREGDKVVPDGIFVADQNQNQYVTSGDYVRKAASKADYGEVQKSCRELIRHLSKLPLPGKGGTALESRGEDSKTKKVVNYGPMFVGASLTASCGNLFGNLVHLDFISKPVTIKMGEDLATIEQASPIMFLKNHYDPKDDLKVPYIAKVKVARTLYSKVPQACPPDMKALYKFLDELREEEKRTVVALTGASVE